MALADTATLLVKLNLGGNFLSQIGKATSGLTKFDKQLGRTEGRAFKAGQQIGTGIKNAGRLAAVGVGFLVSQVALGLNSLIELEQSTAQTNAVIKSTGAVAGVTADEVRRLAEQYESLNATVGDEVIQSAENLLLTFTNVRKQAFEPALATILDMNTALGKGPEGLTSTALLVGKALQDPEKGLSRLGRAVGGFSDETIKAVKEAVKQNDILKAQTIILAELDKRYRGSFVAQGNTTAGKVAKFTDSIEDLQRALAEALLPTLGNVADALSKTLADPKVVQGVREFGKQLANLVSPANIAEGGRILGQVIDAARGAAPIIASAASTIGQVLGTAVKLFNSLPKELQTLAITGLAINKLTGGLVTNIAGGLISSVLKQLVSGVVNVSGAVVNVNGAIPGAAGAAAGGRNVLGNVARAVVPVAIVAGGLELGTAVAGINDPRHQTPGGRTFRGTNVPSEQLANLQRALPQLIERADRGDRVAARQLESVRAEIARLTGAAVSSITSLAGDTRSELAGIRQAVAAQRQAVPIVNVDVNVTPSQVQKSTVIQYRYGPPNGSRGSGPRRVAEFG